MPRNAAIAIAAWLALLAPGPAVALPVTADLSHPLADGWTNFSCGPLGLLTCIAATVAHELTIQLPDGSSAAFSIELDAEPVLSSVHTARPRYTELTGAGGMLAALDAHGIAYSTTSYELLELAGRIYDFRLLTFDEPWAPAAFRYTDPGGSSRLLVGDGSGHFVPEPALAPLLAAVAAAISARTRRR